MNKDQEVFARSIAEERERAGLPPRAAGPKRHVSVADFEAMSEAEKRAEYEEMNKSTQPMTLGQFAQLQTAQAEAIADYFKAQLKPFVKEFVALQERVKELEARPIPRFVSILRPQPENADD